MERNLRWFRWHQLVAGALFWAPTTFLYLIARFGLSTALQAQVVYYVAVVVLEVPSGWFSDRFGRVLTLRTVAVAWVGAHALFLTEPGFAGIAVAQVMLAAGYAFLSGSDTTFHLETLECVGRADEYHDREAAVRRVLLWSGAASALVGGALGTIDLRLPFAAALLAAAVQFVLALRLTEPPVVDAGANDPGGLVAGIGHLRTPLLGWITAFVGVSVVSAHLAADLAAPYLTEVLDTDPEAPGAAALLNGAVAAVVAAVAAVALHIVVPTGRRFGPVRTLLLLLVVPVVILMAMAGVTSLWLLPLMTIRRLPSAAVSVFAPPLVAGFVGPRSRATFLSMASFIGRLAYAGVLLALSTIDDDLGRTLTIGAAIAGGSWLAVALAARRIRPWPTELGHGHEHAHVPIGHEHHHSHGDGHHDHDHDHLDEPGSDGDGHLHVHDHEGTHHSHPHLRDAHHGHDHDDGHDAGPGR
ncbi:MAG: hypothetical protein AAGF02_06115 [Actinomycetota bacterium]